VLLPALQRADGRYVRMYPERVGHALNVSYAPRHEDKHTAFGQHVMGIMATTNSGHRDHNGMIQVLVGVGQQNENPEKVTVQGVLA